MQANKLAMFIETNILTDILEQRTGAKTNSSKIKKPMIMAMDIKVPLLPHLLPQYNCSR